MILLGPFSFYPTPLSPVLAVDANRVKTTCHQPLVFTFNNIRTNIQPTSWLLIRTRIRILFFSPHGEQHNHNISIYRLHHHLRPRTRRQRLQYTRCIVEARQATRPDRDRARSPKEQPPANNKLKCISDSTMTVRTCPESSSPCVVVTAEPF